MKRIIIIVAFINLLPALCCGQQIVWQNHYGGDGYEFFLNKRPNSSILVNANKEYITAGVTSSFGVYNNQYAIKVNDEGDFVWQLHAGATYQSDMTQASIKTFDGNYFMIGFANSQSINVNDIRLTKFTDGGDTIFSKIILTDSLYQAIAKDICYTPDGNYMAACGSYDNIVLVKLNNEGDTLWVTRPLPSGLGSGSPVFFELAHDSSAYYGVSEYLNTDLKSYWFKTDTAGHLLELKQLFLPDSQSLYDITKIIMLPNGNLLMHGRGQRNENFDNMCPVASGFGFGFLYEYDEHGEVVRERTLCLPDEGSLNHYEQYDDFIVAEDSSIYLIRERRLKKLDKDWNDEWEFNLDLAPEVNLLKVSQFEYGYLIAAGELWINIDDTDIFMCKIALPEAIGIEEDENDEIRLYPNPANTQLTIQTNINGKSDYFIYDLTGSLLQSGSFIQAKTVDVKEFAEGVYVIQLQTEQGTISKKFVKQN